jgi:hypothetical protein
MSWGGLVALACILTVGGIAPVWADVIDGQWCFPDGKRFSIRGPVIVTPTGTRTEGNYSRHFFMYVVPASDPDAGQTVSMVLVNEETVHLRIGATTTNSFDGPMQVWHRCSPPTS